jgi:hypothetical protein
MSVTYRQRRVNGSAAVSMAYHQVSALVVAESVACVRIEGRVGAR